MRSNSGIKTAILILHLFRLGSGANAVPASAPAEHDEIELFATSDHTHQEVPESWETGHHHPETMEVMDLQYDPTMEGDDQRQPVLKGSSLMQPVRTDGVAPGKSISVPGKRRPVPLSSESNGIYPIFESMSPIQQGENAEGVDQRDPFSEPPSLVQLMIPGDTQHLDKYENSRHAEQAFFRDYPQNLDNEYSQLSADAQQAFLLDTDESSRQSAESRQAFLREYQRGFLQALTSKIETTTVAFAEIKDVKSTRLTTYVPTAFLRFGIALKDTLCSIRTHLVDKDVPAKA